MTAIRSACVVVAAGMLPLMMLVPLTASAQSLGTFRWQLQPHCNIVSLAVTQNGGVFRLEGTDDQCGGGVDLASVVGTAFQNPDGTIGFGLTIVASPGGGALHVDAAITIGTLSGSWRDSAGSTGAFVRTPGAGSGGTPRPLPAPIVPAAIRLLSDGGFLAGGTSNIGSIPTSGPGVRMMWHPAKAALRAGSVTADQWDNNKVGQGSTALGENTVASGIGSTALGARTTASEPFSTAMGNATAANAHSSTAMGQLTTASGAASTAMGNRTIASGLFSLAMGDRTTASGVNSTTMGVSTTASGLSSTAMGHATIAVGDVSLATGLNTSATGAHSTSMGTHASTFLHEGSFVYGDKSTFNSGGAIVANDAPNQFMVRAAGGYKLFSNAALTAGVQVTPGGNAWSTLSDARMKSHVRELAVDEVLAKIAQMPVREWSYISQRPSIRHMGPTAQDFYAAFGLGEDPLRISTIDADGVALAAVRALEARTRQLQSDNASLRQELADVKRTLDAIQDRKH